MQGQEPVTTHYLKCWPQYFSQIRAGYKPFELRPLDPEREYLAGDDVMMQEWNPETEQYTGRQELGTITYVFPYKVQFQLEAAGPMLDGIAFGVDYHNVGTPET